MVNCRIAISDREVAGHRFGDLPLLAGLAWLGLAQLAQTLKVPSQLEARFTSYG